MLSIGGLPVHSVAAVQEMLHRWSAQNGLAPSDRLTSALAGVTSGKASTADVAVLLRQVLRSDDVNRAARLNDQPGATEGAPIAPAWLDVPFGAAFEPDHDWAMFGLRGSPSQRNDATRIWAEPWTPTWLEGASDHPVDHEVSNATSVRLDESVRADPFLQLLDSDFKTYRSPGQRAAVRSALVTLPEALWS